MVLVPPVRLSGTPVSASPSRPTATCKHCELQILLHRGQYGAYWVADPRPSQVIMDMECPARPRPGVGICFDEHEPV